MRIKNNTNSFTIARYILLFLVVIITIVIIAWTLVSSHRRTTNSSQQNVIHISNNDPCVQDVTNTISRIWAYSPSMVPQKYADMIRQYINAPITERINGACNDTRFVCRPGQIRRECDPCALASARAAAMDQHIADTVARDCATK